MHILLIHQAFAALDEAGGTRHYEMAQYLVAHGHQVTIIASPVSYLSGKRLSQRAHWVEKLIPQPGITILRTYTLPVLHRGFALRVLSFFSFMISSFIEGLKVRHVDLVWGTSPSIFQGVTAWALARLKRVPFLFEVRDLWPAFAIAVGVLKNKVLISLSQGLERFLYRHADQVMVNSPGYIDHVQENGARNVALIPNGADPKMFHPQGAGNELRQQLGLEGKFIVLYAGAHGLSNDLGVVIAAADLLRSRFEIHFLFVGDGKEKPALQRQAQALELTNVTFLSSVPKNEMDTVMAASDACLAILKPIEMYKTTYPNKVFDYMAAGKPVVLAIDGVIREVVESTSAGVAVQPGNPQDLAQGITYLTEHPAQAHAMGQAGRNAIEQSYNRSTFSQEFELLLKNLR